MIFSCESTIDPVAGTVRTTKIEQDGTRRVTVETLREFFGHTSKE